MQPTWFFTWNEILLIKSEALRSTLELFAGWPNRSALDMAEEPCNDKVGECKDSSQYQPRNTNQCSDFKIAQEQYLQKTFGEKPETPFQNPGHRKTETMKLISHSRISVLLHYFPQPADHWNQLFQTT